MGEGLFAKRKWGLSVKNIEFFNLSLLGKWVWRFLVGGDSFWVKILKSKYGKWSNLLEGVASDKP